MVMAKQPQVGGDVKERAWQVCPSPLPPLSPGDSTKWRSSVTFVTGTHDPTG